MADKILHKRNLTQGTVPTTASLSVGELAINVPDGKLFLRQSGSVGDSIIQIGLSASYANTASYYAETDPIFTAVSGTFATTASNTFIGDQTFNGNITVNGTASVALLYTTYETASVIYSSGSTKFGDTADDTHQFTGSLFVSLGNILPVLDTNLSQLSSGDLLSVDWAANYLYRTDNFTYSNNVSLDWLNGKTFDANSLESIDWTQRTLSTYYGISVDWNGGILRTPYGLAVSSLNWSNRQLISADGTSIATDWNTKELLSTGNRTSIDWENRELVGSDGLTHVLNWNTTASSWFSGSVHGTASHALSALSASYALSSSYAFSATTASYASTASYVNPLHQNVIITGSLLVTGSHISTLDYIDFTILSDAQHPPHQEGRVHWIDDTKTLNIDTDVANFTLEIGHQNILRFRNTTGGVLAAGKVVYINGESGNRPTVATASWDGDPSSAATLGFVAQAVNDSQTGYVVTNGLLRGINTTAYAPGTQLYLSSSGNYTSTIPVSPKHEVRLGKVVTSANNGVIYVDIMNGYEIGELHDVLITGSVAGDLLVKSGSLWINTKQLTGSYAVTGSLTATSFTGSLLGTASYATQALSASYAPATPPFPYTGSALITGSLGVTGSASILAYTSSADKIFNVRNSANTADIFTIQGNTLTQIGDKDVAYTPLTEKLLVTGLRNTDVIAKLYGGGTTNSSLTELQLGGFNSPVLNIGTTYSNPTNRFTTAGQIQLSNNSLTNLVFGNSGTNTRGWGFYYTTAGGVTAENQVVAQITRYGTLSLGNTDVREYTESNTLIVKTGTNPSTNDTDSFKLYSADRGGTAGRASAHFRSEDGTINVLGDLSGFGTSSPGARLDVRAQGALSTDIAFRVRNSADTINNFSVDGLGYVNTRINGTNFTRTLIIGGGNTNNKVDAASYDDCVLVGFNNTVAGYAQVNIGNGNNLSTGLGQGVVVGLNNSTVSEITLGYNNSGRGVKIGRDNTLSVLNGQGANSFIIGNYITVTNSSVNNNTLFFGARTTTGTAYASMHENNFGIGGVIPSLSNYDLNARGVFYTQTGTAPTSLAADTFALYSADIVAGNAAPHFRTENGSIIKLYAQPAVSSSQGLADVLTNLGFLTGSSVITSTAAFPYTGSAQITGSVVINNYINTAVQITANAGSTTIYALPTASYDGAWFEYSARSGSNARAGQITAIWSGSAVNFTETTTTDFGTTAGLALGVFIVGTDMALTASAATSGWTIKTIIRSM